MLLSPPFTVESCSHLDFRLVDHVLCAAIRDMLNDYKALRSQLEHTFNTSPSIQIVHALSLFYQLILKLATANDDDASSPSSSERGGEVSTVIYERMQAMSGDPSAVNLYGTLLTAAGMPYVEMFRVWTTTGRPEDPYKKLCIKESKYISTGILEVDFTDEYWEGQYTWLRDGSTLSSQRRHTGVPPPRAVEGKYLNVIRECGIEVQADQKDLTKTSLSMEDEKHISSLGWVPVFFFVGIFRLYKFIEGACTHANHLAHMEQRKPAKGVSIVELRSLLGLALTGESVVFREDVRVSIASSILYGYLFKVISVSGGEEGKGVPDEEANKDRDREKDDKKAKASSWRRCVPNHLEFEQWRLRGELLRASMLAFVQQMLAYTTFEVLEPSWRVLETKLGKATTVHHLLRYHVDFLYTCLKECMLTSAKLLRAYSRMIVTCSTFALYTSFTKTANQALAAAESGDGDQATNEFLKKFESNFKPLRAFHLDCVQHYVPSEKCVVAAVEQH
ncbi:Spc98 family-domain-containing protein [Suillus americanus]|nr:Spc98 family-domain-containing protein [Suillus americanus]